MPSSKELGHGPKISVSLLENECDRGLTSVANVFFPPEWGTSCWWISGPDDSPHVALPLMSVVSASEESSTSSDRGRQGRSSSGDSVCPGCSDGGGTGSRVCMRFALRPSDEASLVSAIAVRALGGRLRTTSICVLSNWNRGRFDMLSGRENGSVSRGEDWGVGGEEVEGPHLYAWTSSGHAFEVTCRIPESAQGFADADVLP